MAPFAECGAL